VLLLFDIDGTLVSGATEAVAEAMRVALLEVHGVDASRMRRRIVTAGRTDGEIARAVLLDAGVSATRIDARADAVRERCCRAYARLCPDDLSHTVLPGVHALLSRLAGRPDVTLGLLTGNYEAIARLKLARAGIGDRFAPGQGAFGSDSEDRAALPAIARRRGGANGRPYPRRHTVVVGDTPRDIACAYADRVRSVAVATGSYTADQLAGADAVVSEIAQLPGALAELGFARREDSGVES
jgi:phosphoglycolate phosphatase-like HAD superfamily hydrolase